MIMVFIVYPNEADLQKCNVLLWPSIVLSPHFALHVLLLHFRAAEPGCHIGLDKVTLETLSVLKTNQKSPPKKEEKKQPTY